MASLKEVKTRIASVNSTRKITCAMKMVASSKLHRAQQAIEAMRPYERRLSHMLTTFVASMEGSAETPYAAEREVKRVAIALYTSNSSLCGGFNANAIKAFHQHVAAYRSAGVEIVEVIPIGKKAADAVRKAGFAFTDDHAALLDHPSYEPAAAVAAHLMEMYVSRAIDKAELIYHHFVSAGTQQLVTEEMLPFSLSAGQGGEEIASPHSPALNFIVEPSPAEVLSQLIPRSLHLKVYTALLDSLASEHAARVIAMQVATDNADELLRELTLTYNKTRQQAITAELLDIVGGSMQ